MYYCISTWGSSARADSTVGASRYAVDSPAPRFMANATQSPI